MPEIQMPKLSDTMTEGTLVAWKKKKGDKVTAGEVIAEIETDKATMEWESPEDGTLTEIYVEEGGKVNVGDKIAFIGEEGEEAPGKEREKPEAKEKKQQKPEPKKTEATGRNGKAGAGQRRGRRNRASAGNRKNSKTVSRKPATPPSRKRNDQTEEARVKASPVARRVAAELGVDLASVNGTGPEGRVTETDVRAAAKSSHCACVEPATATKAGLRQPPRPAKARASIFPGCAKALPSVSCRARDRSRIFISTSTSTPVRSWLRAPN